MSGVELPLVDGRRSSSAFGRAVVADALRAVDPAGAAAVERERDWRRGYVPHFRRLLEAGLGDRAAALATARAGLAAVRWRVVVETGDGDVPLADPPPGGPPLRTEVVHGRGDPERELSLPVGGRRLRGADLHRRLDAWVAAGTLEPAAAEAVRAVAANPDWLRLDGLRVAVLGAGSEMGPLLALLRWGADVAAVDLPRPQLWRRVLDAARERAGRLAVPVAADGGDLADRAGADLLTGVGRVAAWLAEPGPPLVLGDYVYADGVLNLRVCAAADAVVELVRARRPGTAVAGLATPTDVFAVPADAVAEAARRHDAGRVARLARRPARVLSGGRLFTPNYPPGAAPGVADGLVPQQGPNYALAKRLQRWRAAVARDEGTTVSFGVAPPTRTRSVLRNRMLAAAYAGAHRFGVEVFDPATSATLMAALLVHDLRAGGPAQPEPWQDEAHRAVHGGLWRMPYAPRSVLGVAVALGWSARS